MARINGEALIDPKAVVLIRWLALSGQSAALVCVFFFLNFEPPFLSAFGIILVGVAVNIWQALAHLSCHSGLDHRITSGSAI